jgi:endonuclease-3
MNSWPKDLEPLIKKYSKQKFPLDYNNRYQLLVMVLLAARASDVQVNKIAGELFKTYPKVADLKKSTPEDLQKIIKSIPGFRKKSQWLIDLAKSAGSDDKIPHTLGELTKLPGIGRKTANVIIRESKDKAEGVVVDLHVVRVAPRLGVVDTKVPDKIEKQLMDVMPQNKWNDIGMTLSFHGREICRPKPKCDECIVNKVCNYYNTVTENEGKKELVGSK